MIVIHSKFRYRGPPKFGGVLQPGDEVLHLLSDAATAETQRAELREFVASARLPRSLLNNAHFLRPGRPHLDVWGRPARRAARTLAEGGSRRAGAAAFGRTERLVSARQSLGPERGRPREG